MGGVNNGLIRGTEYIYQMAWIVVFELELGACCVCCIGGKGEIPELFFFSNLAIKCVFLLYGPATTTT